ncbi:MAG TPA: hypothetical protein VMM12_09555 [Longimicrobiales bacterium]|nr:hypothetical protein [Longimicrobiales bacterium]
MFGDLFYRLGQVLGGLEKEVRDREGAVPAEDGPDEAPREGASDRSVATAAILSTAAAWLASMLLRPKPVSWPRVILAGAGGALLADLVGRVQDGAQTPGRLPYADDPMELLGRVSAGIGVAAGYASIVYPRLPGPPLFRGLAFGALEVAAAPRGGFAGLSAQAPGLWYPLQALALPVDEDASPLALLAFGLVLGMLYRGVSPGDEEWDEEEWDDEEGDDQDRDDEE